MSAQIGSPLQQATIDLIPGPVWISVHGADDIRCNAAWQRLTGTPGSLSLQQWLQAIHPEDRAAAAGWNAQWDGVPLYDAEIRLAVTGMQYRRFVLRAQRRDDDGNPSVWTGILFDIESVRAAQEQNERVYQTLADELPQLVGLTAPDGKIQYLNRRSAEYTGVPLEQRGMSSWRQFVHPDDLPTLEAAWGNALRSGERLETMYRFRRKDGVYRWFLNQAVPVRDDAGNIVSWIGTAVDIDEHKRREDALRVTVQVNEIFAATLDVESALQKLADASVRHLLADWCGVYLYDSAGKLRPVAIAHHNPEAIRSVREYLQRYPIAETDSVAKVAATGVPERMGPITRDMYDAIEDPERRTLARSFKINAVMNLPLIAGDERFGAFSLAISDSDRVFDDDDQRIASMLAQRAAIALSTAKLFERQREVARTLQNAFLPASLPLASGSAWDATYVSATRDVSIGGDWYDVEQRSDGRFSFAVGDVAGHGLDAAVTMGKMRQTFRVLGALENDPAKAAQIAHEILRREHPDVFVTAFVALYDAGSGSLRYVNAGHPRPFIRTSDGVIRRLGEPGPPLGLAELQPPVTRQDRLHESDLLIAFTDGLIEINRDIVAAEDELMRRITHPAFAVCSSPASLLRALMVRTEARDDIAILTLRHGGGPDWTFDPSDASYATGIRKQFVAKLHAWRITGDSIATHELVVGEILANKVRHVRGLVDVAVERNAKSIVVRVVDRGAEFDWRSERPSEHSENGRGLYLIDTLSKAVRFETLPGFGTYLEVTLSVGG